MENQSSLSIIFPLVPLFVGIAWKAAKPSFSSLKTVGLATIAILILFLCLTGETDLSVRFLAFAVLLSGFCTLFPQEKSPQAAQVCTSSLITLGLALGTLLNPGLMGRLFLCGFLGYTAYSLNHGKSRSFRTSLILINFIVAIVLALTSAIGGDSLRILAGLFLAVTFLPLVPFHLPFVGTVAGTQGALASFSIVVWLAIGLAELNTIYSLLSDETLFAVSLLALVSALYSSLAALGQRQGNVFVAAATVAYISLVWGLLNIFPGFPSWGIAFGIAVAFVLAGVCLSFSFVRQRYGSQTIGQLPGLATPMPRFGTLMVLLVAFTLFLPMFPTFSGLTSMPMAGTLDLGFVTVFLLFFSVWLGGGWFFLQMLHQTAFGAARAGVPYTDLKAKEIVAVSALLIGAGYSGLFY